ncbi:MAG TPA: Gfo/Idh/MocA family oxidoreductase [Sedimentisphaerales bacterium]|nr:Gfo/Idh/MocA family oxidoreductase [Sedimentisphaerales bacterium]HQG49173.1 Gfo/Idh/MocA family oxidoreductase [Sedimentisphaerales bacterium]
MKNADHRDTTFTRRQILRAIGAGGLAAGFPAIVPSSVLGKDAPSNQITIAMIGMGRQALYANLEPFLNSADARVVAVCDVDRWRLEQAKQAVDQHYQNGDCRAYADWREVLTRTDIDAVMNSTPDHWHVPISLAAVRLGKHVSCEKPLTLSVAEGRVLADAVKKHGVTFRTDSECRSDAYMHKTAELVRNGYLGRIKRIEVGVPTGDVAGGSAVPEPVPEGLNYEMWVGPAPLKPYTVDRVHPVRAYTRPGWMRCRDTCEGMVTNWGTHMIDVAQQAHDSERTGPVSVEGKGEYPAPGSGLWDVLLNFQVQYRYADGVVLDYHTDQGAFLRVEGEDGWIHAPWLGGQMTASDPAILRIKLKENDVRLPLRQDKEDFLYGIKHKATTMADAEVGHRTCSMCQLGHIAIRRDRKLYWNAQTERFVDDDEANRMLSRSYRRPWGLDIV